MHRAQWTRPDAARKIARRSDWDRSAMFPPGLRRPLPWPVWSRKRKLYETYPQSLPNELSSAMLNGFDGNGQQIVDQADFLLQERFRVGDPAKHAVEARHGLNARTNFVVGGKQVFARFLIAEL